MKKLNILAAALVASALSLPALADINISGDGRYRIGNKADAAKTQYRNYRMRTTISAGSDLAGISARFDVEDQSTAAKGPVTFDNLNAFFKLGMVRVDAGDLGTGYGGFVGTKLLSGKGDRGDFKISMDTGVFDAFIRSTQGDGTVATKGDTLSYGFGGTYNGITARYVSESNIAGGSSKLFDGIRISGNVSGVDFSIQKINDKDRTNATGNGTLSEDQLVATVSVPVSGFTVKLGYADFSAGANNDDGIAILGEGIFSGGYGAGDVGERGIGNVENKYTAVALAGSAAGFGYQITFGSNNDNTPTTPNSFYDVSVDYALDTETTLSVGFGRAHGQEGIGFEASYKF